MEKNQLGIIGGAGPLAGALLMEKVIEIYQKERGAKKDEDFPFIALLSVPFSDMLSLPLSCEKKTRIQKELLDSLEKMEMLGITKCAIACNTLHSFLPKEKKWPFTLLNLIEITQQFLEKKEGNFLLLCTSTTRQADIYRGPIFYPDEKDQKIVDQVIDCILAGSFGLKESKALSQMIESYVQKNGGIEGCILGCTELSLLAHDFPLKGGQIIDPLTCISYKLISRSGSDCRSTVCEKSSLNLIEKTLTGGIQ